MINCNHLTKRYKNGDDFVVALDDVSLSFPGTGLVAIIGESGCGKSTLLNLLGGLDNPDSGEIVFEGRPLPSGSELDDYRKDAVSFCFQQANLLPDLTVRENITLCSKFVSPKKVEAICERLGIKNEIDRKASTLSGGQAQRAALARALYRGSPLLLCDEPTGSLDEGAAESVFSLLKSLSSSRLVIVVTHNKTLADDYADRVIELKGGKVVKDETKEQQNEEAPVLLPERDNVKNRLNLKMLLHCFSSHPVRSFFSALMLGFGFGALIPLLSVVTKNGSALVASSVASSSSPSFVIKKSQFANAYSPNNMFPDEVAGITDESYLPVYQYSLGLGYGHSSPYIPSDYIAETSWRNDWVDTLFATKTSGIAAGSEGALTPLGLTLLSGAYPKENECLISDVQYSLFAKYGFIGADGHRYSSVEITSPSTFLSFSPKIDARINQKTIRLSISGVLETGFDRSSYNISNTGSFSTEISKSILSQESTFSPYSLLFVSEDVISENFGASTNYVALGDLQTCLFDSKNTGVRSLRRLDLANSSLACFAKDGCAVPLGLFGTVYGGQDLMLEGIETKDYVSCLSFYSDFNEISSENRYFDSSFLFADYLPAKASNLSLLAVGNYVSKNGLPDGEAYSSFLTFAKEQYEDASKTLKREIPDFDSGNVKAQGYLKSLYVWYLSTPEMHLTGASSLNIREGGYAHNEFGEASGLQITKEFIDSLLEKEGFSSKQINLDFARSTRDEDNLSRTVSISGLNLVDDKTLHVPSYLIDDLKHFLGDSGPIRFLLVKNTHSKNQVSRYASGFNNELGHYCLSAPALTSYEYFGDYVFSNFALLSGLLGGSFSLLSVALLALMLKQVSGERAKEMALRRCLGESKKDVFLALFAQSFVFGLIGFILSSILGALFSGLLNSVFLKGVATSLRFFSINFWSVLACLGMILLCCVVSSVFFALKGARQSLAMNLSRNS